MRSTILVVEDNPDMNRFICESLEPRYHTLQAFDGRDGVQQAIAHAPDLIVSDIMMPELSGDQLVAELRRIDAFRHTPILLLTAKADEDMRIRLLREGAQDYLTKPFAAEELTARIDNLVTMKRARDLLQRELETQIGDLETLAAEVTHQKRDLGIALASMKVAREQAERASMLKLNFLSVVSHELRAPLATLKVQLERLRLEHQATGDPGSGLVERMSRSAERLQVLVDDLLHYTRLQSGPMEIELEDIVLPALMHEILAAVLPLAEAKRLELRVEVPEGLPPLRSDLRLLRLVVFNLLDNAVKFTERGGVYLGIEHHAPEWTISIRDTGPGILPADQVRIFEPFEQVGSPRNKNVAGIGLGLALVREIAVSLGGAVGLTSQLGVGTTFTVTLRDPAIKAE